MKAATGVIKKRDRHDDQDKRDGNRSRSGYLHRMTEPGVASGKKMARNSE